MSETATRFWQRSDTAQLHLMVLDCLRINHEAGADMLPTDKNATVLVEMGMLAAERTEPCFVIELANRALIGYTLWIELPNPIGLDFAGRVLHGFGTYVRPSFQKAGLSHMLRNTAEAQASRLGFTKVVGVAYHQAGLQSVLARSYRIAGYHVEKGL